MSVAHCPGSGHNVGAPLHRDYGCPAYATCPYCRRGFAVNLNGRIRKHNGLPAPAGGGCPYRCPGPECDFACYHGKKTPPKRIQRKRTAGWQMPEGTIYVGRPTVFGNPWKVVGAGTEPGLFGGRERVYTIDGPGQFFRGTYTLAQAAEFAVHMYTKWINVWPTEIKGAPEPLDANCGLKQLRGHDLACWCPLEFACHADVLLKLANGEPCPTS